jgi:hypothetical protein
MTSRVRRILDRLEKQYGKLKPLAPAGAYAMVVYANCGYPANDATCGKGVSGAPGKCGDRAG